MTDPRNHETNGMPDEAARVVAFPATEQGNSVPRQGWTFDVELRRVGGSEGEWLSRELAEVVRELLVWAHHDRREESSSDDEGERAA
jgi:hypothetical protein